MPYAPQTMLATGGNFKSIFTIYQNYLISQNICGTLEEAESLIESKFQGSPKTVTIFAHTDNNSGQSWLAIDNITGGQIIPKDCPAQICCYELNLSTNMQLSENKLVLENVKTLRDIYVAGTQGDVFFGVIIS